MSRSALGAGLFPLPMVQPPRTSTSRSRRIQQRLRRATADTELANGVAAALNRLNLSYPTSPNIHTRNSTHLTSSTNRALAHVHACAKRFNNSCRLSSSGCDTSGGLLSLQERIAPAAYSNITDSLPLEASRVSLPSGPGSVDLVDILPP